MEFLDKLPLDQTALTIAMVAIVLVFALISIVKGIIKTIVSLISFSLSGATFLFGFLKSPPHIENFIPEATSWMPLVVGGVGALLAMVLIQLFLGILSGKSRRKKKKTSSSDSFSENTHKERPRRNFFAPFFGLAAGTMVLYGVITAIRYFGTTAELEHLQTYVSEGSENAGELPLLAQAKQWLDDSPIATWHEKVDFLNTSDYRSRLNLAKLIIISGDKAELAKALQDGVNKEVLTVPEINAITLTGDDLRSLCEDCDFNSLFQNERFQRLSSRPSTSRALKKFRLDQFFTREGAKTTQ